MPTYNGALPRDTDFIADGPAAIRNNFEAIRVNRIVDAGTLNGYTTGNANGNIPISNGVVCTNLNADTLDGLHASSFAPIGHVNSTTGHPLATASADGFMSKADFSKLAGIAAGAQVNQNAFSNVVVGSTTIAAENTADTLTLVAGTGITLTPDATNDKVTFSIANGAITSALIADGTIVTGDIADGQITTAKLANSSVTTAKILAGNITTALIADGNVTTAKIADKNVTTGKLADLAVTAAKIANNTITNTQLASGVAAANLGYTPLNKAGDTMTGTLGVSMISAASPVQILNGSAAQKIHTGGVLSSDAYSDASNIPTNGIYSKGAIKTANQFISTVGTGTAPLAVSSTTVNTNLNADMLDGYHASAFALASHTHTGNQITSAVGTAAQLYGTMAENDYYRISGGSAGSNAGYLEIATADDGTEPIYVRQYTGVFGTIARTATLLDGSGNTYFPGTVYSGGTALAKVSQIPTTLPANGGTSAACSGNAATASVLQNSRTISLTGAVTGSVSFNGGSDVTMVTSPSASLITTSKVFPTYAYTGYAQAYAITTFTNGQSETLGSILTTLMKSSHTHSTCSYTPCGDQSDWSDNSD